MHVAGEPDAAHGGKLGPVRDGQLVHRLQRCRPPVGRILLGPARMRAFRLRRARTGFAKRLSRRIDQQRLDAGRPDINAEESHEARTSDATEHMS